MDDATLKISATEPIKFRPGKMGPPIAKLMARLARKQPGIQLSSILREGLEAYWPQIEAYLITRQAANVDARRLVQITGICAKALEHGVTAADLESYLDALIEQKLSA